MKNNKKPNYNYIYLVYDIKENRVNKVFKICKKYLEHYQNSVFRGEITSSNILKLKNELNKIINKNEDNILILYFYNKKDVTLEEFGIKTNETNFL